MVPSKNLGVTDRFCCLFRPGALLGICAVIFVFGDPYLDVDACLVAAALARCSYSPSAGSYVAWFMYPDLYFSYPEVCSSYPESVSGQSPYPYRQSGACVDARVVARVVVRVDAVVVNGVGSTPRSPNVA